MDETQAVGTKTSGIADAVSAAGSQLQLATQLGVTQQAVSGWVLQGWAPHKRAIEIEMLTGVSRVRLVDPRLLDLIDAGVGTDFEHSDRRSLREIREAADRRSRRERRAYAERRERPRQEPEP
jgi:DNA-binding transcriptional regulator YdaS (Cro superfamily)